MVIVCNFRIINFRAYESENSPYNDFMYEDNRNSRLKKEFLV